MIARLEVTRGTLTEYPLAEKTRGGWQNGVTFYPDAEVTKVTPLIVSRACICTPAIAGISDGPNLDCPEHGEPQGEPSDAAHSEHVTVNWAYWGNCLEGDCEHVDEDGQPEDLSACPNVPPFEVCVNCMDDDGRGRDPEHWDDVPLIAWPCVVVTEQGENR